MFKLMTFNLIKYLAELFVFNPPKTMQAGRREGGSLYGGGVRWDLLTEH